MTGIFLTLLSVGGILLVSLAAGAARATRRVAIRVRDHSHDEPRRE